MLKREFFIFALSCLCLLSTSVVFAEGHRASLERALEQVKGRTHGKVLSANTVREGSRNVHNIRVITEQGRVKRFRVDARSGKILNQRPGRHAPPPNRR